MRLSFSLLIPVIFTLLINDSFKDEQMKYPRVRDAYQQKKDNAISLMATHDIDISSMNIYFRAFKSEKKLELWAKNQEDKKYTLITTFDICRISGKLGPKRRQGDLQIPEGFYHINIFNPASQYHLSLGLNYPNKSDRILGYQPSLGGDIFIHGKCVTIGCLPMTDETIKLIYVISVEAKNGGQQKIPVTIFPFKMTDQRISQMTASLSPDHQTRDLWSDLKKGQDLFNATHELPSITFLNDGRHRIN